MEDRYLFRGKAFNGGDWYYGSLIERRRDGFPVFYIYENSCDELNISEYSASFNFGIDLVDLFVEINPATLGQCTGLKDRNGKLIFEGDIIGEAGYTRDKFVIEYNSYNCQFIGKHEDGGIYHIHEGERNFIEVIGNIHDEVNHDRD